MKHALVVTACFCLVMAGCGTYSETRVTKLNSPPGTIAIGEFKGNDPGIAQFFADTIAGQLSAGGLKIITDQNQADIVITGAVSYKTDYWSGHINDWILTAKTKEGQIVAMVEFHEGYLDIGHKWPKEIVPELAQRLSKALRNVR